MLLKSKQPVIFHFELDFWEGKLLGPMMWKGQGRHGLAHQGSCTGVRLIDK